MWARLLTMLKTDFHVPVALVVFLATSAFHFWTRIDLGTQYTSSIYALYAFLGGHAFTSAKYPTDPPTQK